MDEIEFFRANGYLVLPGALAATEVAALNGALDADLEAYPRLWKKGGDGRLQSVHALMNLPAFDATVCHPSTRPLVEALMGEDVCCEEHSVMLRGPLDAEPPPPAWHRDTGHWPEHPLALLHLSLIFYLTDVGAGTHCFAAVPEDAEAKRRLPADGEAAGAVDLHGAAGTAVLFNAGSCHAARLRRTARERRTVHLYYGHASKPPLSEHTVFPRRLLESEDPALRRYCRRPNQVTRAVLRAFAGSR